MGRWMAAAVLLAAAALAAQCGPDAQLRQLAVQLYLNYTGVHMAVPCDRVEGLVVPAGGPAPHLGPLGSFHDPEGLVAALREARERALARVGIFVNSTVKIYMADAARLMDAGLPDRTAEVAARLDGLARLLGELNLSVPLVRPVADMASCLKRAGNITAPLPAEGGPEEALRTVERLMERIRDLWGCFERVKVTAPKLLQERLAVLNATRAAIVQAMGLPPDQRTEAVREAIERANR